MPSQLSPLDRPNFQTERWDPSVPLSPINGVALTVDVGVNDIRWDNPQLLVGNQKYQIIGVNVYRAFDSAYSNYQKITSSPVGGLFLQDSTQNITVTETVAPTPPTFNPNTNTYSNSGFERTGTTDPTNHWTIQTSRFPIVKPNTQAIPTDNPADVTMTIDGQFVPIFRVLGETGEIELITGPIYDPSTQSIVEPILPGPNSVVQITYTYNSVLISVGLNQRIFYKLTSVAMSNGQMVESPLDQATPISVFDTENLDYIWREAMRRNRWILEQGGERIKVFIYKWNGIRCPNWDPDHQQARNDCLQCYGTGILGGYEGPFNLIIAPPNHERRVRLIEYGLKTESVYETWTGAYPLLNERDFIRKQNGEVYSIGPVTVQSARGYTLQQSFSIAILSEQDIRCKVPNDIGTVFTTTLVTQPGDYNALTDQAAGQEPVGQVTNKPNIPDSRQDKGRTATYEDITY